jgi:protein-disulfide isomerase
MISKAQINQNQLFLIIGGLIVVLFVIYLISPYLSLNKNLNNPNSNNIQETNIDVNSILGNLPPIGNPQAPIKIVEFGDFHCPYCAQVINNIYPFIENYLNEGKVVFYFRDFPLEAIHPFSKNVHLASRCANEQGKYWEFHKRVFADFIDKLGQKTGDKDYLFNLAKELNLDQKKFEDCYNSKKYEQDINKDYQDGLILGVEGTPSFYVNNLFIKGLDVKSLLQAINLQLTKINNSQINNQ